MMSPSAIAVALTLATLHAKLRMLPKREKMDAAMLMNRWTEAAWMVHRLMPTLQMQHLKFPDDWRRQWTVLDESFAPMVQSLSNHLGKKIGDAMVEFVNTKFPFGVDSFNPPAAD